MTKKQKPLTIEDRTFIERSLLEGMTPNHISINSWMSATKVLDELNYYKQSTSVYNAKTAHFIFTNRSLMSGNYDGLCNFIYFMLRTYYNLIENDLQHSPLMGLINYYLYIDHKCSYSLDEKLEALELFAKYRDAKKASSYLKFSHSTLNRYITSIKQRIYT